MKKSLFGFLILSVISFGFISCSDDDDDRLKVLVEESGKFTKEVTTIECGINGGGTRNLQVHGGKGNYSVKSNDENIVKVSISTHDIVITPISLGQTGITITDKDNNTLTIPVKVVTTLWGMDVQESYPFIKTEENAEVNEADIEEIKETVQSRLLPKGAAYKMEYTNIGSGKLTVYPNPSSEKGALEGTFEYAEVSGKYGLIFKYNGNTYKYIFSTAAGIAVGDERSVREVGPRRMYLIEDLTEEFKLAYPDLKLLEVVGVQRVSVYI